MEKKDVVGYRFQPTEEELINHYLKNKNLGKSWLVDDGIREINICSYEPMHLPSLSKIKSKDLAWYFFSPKVYTSAKKTEMKRTTTSSGFWKVAGKDRKIKDKRGKGVEIGFMKPLVYYQGRSPNGVRTLWAIHEYHITCLSDDQIKYVICQVIYKGEDRDILYGNNFNLSEPSHSFASDLNTDTVRAINTALEVEQQGGICLSDLTKPMDTDNNSNVQQQAPYSAQGDDEFLSGLMHVNRGHVEHLFSDQEDVSPCGGFDPYTFLSFDSYNGWNIKYDEILSGLVGSSGGNDDEDVFLNPELIVRANRNDHRPNTSLSGIIVDCSSDSDRDTESISATSYQETSSPDSSKDLQTWESQSQPLKQEVKEGKTKAADATIDQESSMVKTEKKGWFIVEEAMQIKGKTPRYVYLMNMIIGFILVVVLIGNMSYRFY